MWLLLLPLLVLAPGVAALHGFRNRLIAAKRGAIEAKLREVFGPALELVAIELDVWWRLKLVAKNVAVPGGIVLDVREALWNGVLAFARSRGKNTAALVLEKLEGTLTLGTLSAPISYVVSEEREAGFVVHGKLEARGATWKSPRGEAAPFDLDGKIRIGTSSWDLVASCKSGEATLQGEFQQAIPPPANAPFPRFTGHLEKVGHELAAHFVALLSADVKDPIEVVPEGAKVERDGFVLPKELVASGDIESDPDLARRASLAFVTESSKLALTLAVKPSGELGESRLGGTLSVRDAVVARIVRTKLRPLEGVATLDARLEGLAARPILSGRLFSTTLPISAGPPDLEPVYPFESVTVQFRLDAERLSWSDLQGTGFQGTVKGSGDFEIATKKHRSRLAWHGVRTETLPTGPGEERGLAANLRASAAGELELSGVSDDLVALEGEGSLVLAEAEYLFLRDSAHVLGTFGLPAPAIQGVGPCKSRLVFQDGRIELAEIEGRTESVRFGGTLGTTWDGAVKGAIEAHLEPSFLARSLLLALPAAFTGRVTVPISVGGRLGKPVYTADLVGTVGGLMKKNVVASVISGITEGLFSVLEGERRAPLRSEKRREERELDQLLEKIIAGGPEGDRLLEQLIATGVTEDEVERMLADFRRRRRR